MAETQALPPHASVVVVGGGVMGCSTLYHLAKLGARDVVLLERNQLTSGTTWHSAAQVRALRSTRNMTELIRYSIQLYSNLERETGQATGWINKGSLSIATTPDRMIHVERQAALAQLFGVHAETVSRDQAKEIWPLMNADDVIGAVWSPDDGRVSPSDLCAALIKGAKAMGARVFEDTGVDGIVLDAGRIAGLETSRGSIRCDALALCTGLWSREAAALAGVDAPVWPCEHFYLLTKPVAGIEGNVPTLSDHDGHLYIRDDSGGLLVGCFEPMGKPIAAEALGHDFAFQLLPEDWDHFEPMMLNALHRLPPLETAEVKMLLNGPESFTPDGTFLLGEAAETRGLFLGCGMNSVGVATGGGAGMALAHRIVEGHMPMDLGEVDPARFPGCWNDASALAERVPEVLGKHYEITYPGRQWRTARGLRLLPLDRAWREQQAQFGQFYGWERPLYFGATAELTLGFGKPDWHDQVAAEVAAAHDGAAVFDQSTLGKIAVEGAGAEAFLERVCSRGMSFAPGRAAFTLILNARGGIEADAVATRLSPDRYRLYVGSGAVKRVMAWLLRHRDGNVVVRDETEMYAVLALTGAKAASLACEVGAEALNELAYFDHGECILGGVPVRAVRMSYVGEAGWEITVDVAHAEKLYRALSAAGARPAGLFAQTSMRIEKGFLAHGHDMDTETTPAMAGLGFAVSQSKDFIGREALQAADEPPSRVVAVALFDDPDAWPLGNEPIFRGEKIVGQTTSAAFGHRIGKHVAVCVVDASAAEAAVDVNIGGRRSRARMQRKAAFDASAERLTT